MLNVVFNDGANLEVNFSNEQYRTWYWRAETGNLILKRSCHVGCRTEIPRENIRYVEVVTKDHPC